MMNLVRIQAGIALLLVGRRLFWLFVGLIGFTSGMHLAARFFRGQPEWMILAIALTAGAIGAVLALFLQWVAIGLAGFSAGGYILVRFLHLSGWGTTEVDWLFFVIGGILGLLLIIVLFDWALIILSSLVGSGLITDTVYVGQGVTTALFIALFVVGLIAQSRLKKGPWQLGK